MFPAWPLTIIFAIFLGGCALFGPGSLVDNRNLRVAGVVSWFVALILLAIFMAADLFGIMY